MKAFIVTFLAMAISTQTWAFNETHSCLGKVNHNRERTKYEIVYKKDILDVVVRILEGDLSGEISDKEAQQVKDLLTRNDTEVFSPYDSSDAGVIINIVSKRNCKSLWAGWLVSH